MNRFGSMRLMQAALASALIVSAVACGSPESPSRGTPSPAANPAPSTAAARPAVETVTGYPEIPAPSGESAAKLNDLQQDLRNVVSGNRGATKDFADDLESILQSSEIRPKRTTLDALSGELATALPKASDPDVLISRLTHLLYVATRQTPMTAERQVALQNDVAALLRTHRVPEASAKSIGAHVATIARESRLT